MKAEFDRRWQQAAAAGRAHDRTLPAAPPPGFATRVAAAWRASRSDAASAIWLALGIRLLGGLCVLLLVLAIVDSIETRQRDGWRPRMGEVVSEAFWIL